MNKKEYTMPDGGTVVFWYDEDQLGKISLEAMDILISMVNEKWIPCSERLPDDGEEYLVTVQCDGHSIVDIDQCFSYGWDDYGADVIAWMPLPKPYQEDNQ